MATGSFDCSRLADDDEDEEDDDEDDDADEMEREGEDWRESSLRAPPADC